MYHPLILVTMLLAFLPGVVSGKESATRLVREGITRYQQGEYTAALEKFQRAEKLKVEDPRILFDQACALAAGGKPDEAIPLFQRAAVARDPHVAAESHYNLGHLSVAKAQAMFGQEPLVASSETRQAGVDLLLQAVSHYRDCLEVEPGHAAARRNLEAIRLWIKHMQAAWKELDRQKRRDEADLPDYLQQLQEEQENLRQQAQATTEELDSPLLRQKLWETARAQRQLAAEMPHLREKLVAALATAMSNGAPAEPLPEDMQKALDHRIGQTGDHMQRAADGLNSQEILLAVEAQDAAWRALDDLYLAVAPLPHLLERSLEQQKKVVSTIKSRTSDEPPATADTGDSLPGDAEQTARQERRVDRWVRVLPERAEAELAQLPPAETTTTGDEPHPLDEAPELPADTSASSGVDASAEEQLAQYRQMLNKAVELGPQIPPLTQHAAEHLEQSDWPAAQPPAEEALRLLEEIAKSTPPESQQDQQQQQDSQQDQDQQPQSENDSSEDSPSEQNNESQSEDSDKAQPKPEEPNEPDESKSQEQEKESGKQPDASEQENRPMTPQQVEALLQRLREREREHRRQRKQLEQWLYRREPVERDW